jgi:hypothetical protein
MKRIQRKRTKGWRMPPNTRYVGRGTRYGNPWSVYDESYQMLLKMTPKGERSVKKSKLIKQVVNQFELYSREQLRDDPQWLDDLRSYDALACWCAIDAPCHADVLIRLLEETEQ